MKLDDARKALLFQTRDLSNTLMPDVIGQVNSYFNAGAKCVSVEESALLFYLLNQTYGNISSKFDKQDDLPEEAVQVVRLYLEEGSRSSARIYYYMLLIITREIRHLHSNVNFFSELTSKFGTEIVSFLKFISGLGSSTLVSTFRDSVCTPDLLANVTLGKYVSAITYAFNHGKFSSGYGGKPWGMIAETLRKMVFGETSIEIMNDTAWTLAHNNGPMFNKGMLYNKYTSAIYKILDVQRAGQIPELIHSSLYDTLISDKVKKAFNLCSGFFSSDVTLGVDWYLVERLGSLKKYTSEKAAQKNKPKSAQPATSTPKVYVNPIEYATVITYKRDA